MAASSDPTQTWIQYSRWPQQSKWPCPVAYSYWSLPHSKLCPRFLIRLSLHCPPQCHRLGCIGILLFTLSNCSLVSCLAKNRRSSTSWSTSSRAVSFHTRLAPLGPLLWLFAGISGAWHYAYVDLGKPVSTEKSLTIFYSNRAMSSMDGTQGAQTSHVDQIVSRIQFSR